MEFDEETQVVIEELNALIHQWKIRDANPIMVCMTTLVKIAALSGQLFEDEDMHRQFLKRSMDSGVKYYSEMKNEEKNYVH